jgi:hypothetical protein
MATRESRGMGIAHLTVVPENFEVEPSSDDETDDTSGGDADNGE